MYARQGYRLRRHGFYTGMIRSTYKVRVYQ